jgi:cytochrome c6
MEGEGMSHNRVSVIAAIGILIFVISVQLHAQAPGDSEALFKAKCAMCHGADAAGKTPMGAKLNIPDLRAPEVQKKSVADTTGIITKGKNKMPAYEGKLTADQISQLSKYIHGLKK